MSKHTLLVIYDVLHFFVLSGERLSREDVIAYLKRAGGLTTTNEESLLRTFERFKRHMRVAGVRFRSEIAGDGSSWIVIPDAHNAKRAVERELDSPAV